MSIPVDPDEPQPVLYTEAGSTWWPVIWGPAFAVVGYGVEIFIGGPAHLSGWLVAGLFLAVASAVWVYARRGVCSVRLTPFALHQGRETLPVQRIAAMDDVGASVGARVLGGGWAPPRGTTGIPLRLDDGATVLAWARHPDGLGDALRRLLNRT